MSLIADVYERMMTIVRSTGQRPVRIECGTVWWSLAASLADGTTITVAHGDLGVYLSIFGIPAWRVEMPQNEFRFVTIDGRRWPEPDTEPVGDAVDVVETGRCACGCRRSLERSPSAWFHSEDCQRVWQQRQSTRPHEVLGYQAIPPYIRRGPSPSSFAAECSIAVESGHVYEVWFR